jgi:hypothetical protein
MPVLNKDRLVGLLTTEEIKGKNNPNEVFAVVIYLVCVRNRIDPEQILSTAISIFMYVSHS